MANFVFYEGPSALDGQPIVAVATFNSDNTKTGSGLVQTWIMRADIGPIAASRNGADASICGACPHRGKYADGMRIKKTRTCYVQLQNAPSSVWGAYRRGRYAVLTAAEAGERLAGYTHQWRGFSELAQWCMASVDSLAEQAQAKILGFRTFRVASVRDWVKQAGEQLCGASHEAGRKVTCDRCMACGGLGSKAKCDIVIPAHGAARARVVG